MEDFIDKLTKVVNAKQKKTLDECLFEDIKKLQSKCQGIDIARMSRIYKIPQDTKVFRKKMKEFGSQVSKVSDSWLRHHIQMISYKIELMKCTANLNLSIKQKFKIILDQLLFRFWKEFKRRSDSVLYKLLKREISGSLPIVLRVNHFQFISKKNNFLRVYFSDGWYLIYHEIQLNLECLDWSKVFHMLSKVDPDSPVKTQVKDLQEIKGKILQMIKLNGNKKNNKDEKYLKNDLELLLLIVSGKLSINRKVLFTGLEFAEEISAEKLADADPHEIDGRVLVNLNSINPISGQNIKLGKFKQSLQPMKLSVCLLYDLIFPKFLYLVFD
jgi:hypothetical protein